MNKNVIQYGFVITLSLFAIAGSGFLAMAADAPSVDTLKQVLEHQLQKLRPPGFTERNVLFQEVRAGTPTAGKYPYQVSVTIRDYGPGYPPNKYYGETCVGHMDKEPFELRRDAFGGWQVEGRMTVTTSDGKKCVPNPSAGVSSFPLASLTGTPAHADPSTPVTPGNTGNKPVAKDVTHGSVAAKSYKCVFFLDSILQNVPGFTIVGGGRYTDAEGKNGTYTFDPAQSLITFHGGDMDGNTASYDGRVIHIYNEKRTRTIIDCD
jgi:hypothetical protein